MKKIILVVVLTFALGAYSQEVKSLTLKDAINYALTKKSDAKKGKLQLENSEYKIQEIRSRALPQISANGGLIYNPILQTTFLDAGSFGGEPGTIIQANFGQKWVSTAGVSLTQPIFDKSVFTGLKAAQTSREFYQINDQLTEEQVIERVANNYYQVYVLRQKLIVIDSNYSNTNKVKNIIRGQFDSGLAKKIDLDRIIVKVSNIETQRQQVLNAVRLQENTLKFYMGMPIETKINIPKTQFEVTPIAFTETSNTSNHSEYQLLKKQEQLLMFQKTAEQAAYYPTLSLTAGYNYIGQGPKMPWGATPAKNVYWSDYSAIGLNLKVPIFNGFETRSKVRQADISLRSLKEDINDTKLQLDLAFENSKIQINNSITT
ncbi:TolC family protein, partial [Flavobacterium sp.]|uniref:TolC family protein n=1 Tax=Flavobacterium sp. TaxID=239 RepID=UPI0025EC21A7